MKAEIQSKNLLALLKKIAEGDERAFRILFDKYYGRLFDIAVFFTKDTFGAQEVVSDVFVKLWSSRTNNYKIHTFNSYLFIAVKRQSLNYLRNTKRHTHLTIDELCSDVFVESRQPDDQLISDEFIQAMNTAIAKLPFKCRLVYQLVKEDGMKYREVAEMLDISVKAVEMHIGKALKRLRLELKTFYPTRSLINLN